MPRLPGVVAGLAGLLLGGMSGCAAPSPDLSPPIVLIVVDALRADHLGLYGYERDTSPHIDRWAERGMMFERAYATSSWTLPSFGSILTGLLPSTHSAGFELSSRRPGVRTQEIAARHFVTLDRDAPTVAETLADHGYDTGAFVANPFLNRRFGLHRGFDDYDHVEASNSELRRADATVDAALDWVDQRGARPFFLLVHLFDPHMDYDAPAPFRGRFDTARRSPVQGLWAIRNGLAELSASERQSIVDAYDEEIAFVDAQLDRFLRGLDTRGLLTESLVILTSDHGEELFDHGGFEHGHRLYEEVVRVPLVLWAPGIGPGRESGPVSLIDLAPTMLHVAGVDLSPELTGRVLLSSDNTTEHDHPERPIVIEGLLYGPDTQAIIDWPFKAILEVGTGDAQLFNLRDDPDEQHDLTAEETEKLGELRSTLAGILMNVTGRGDAAEVELDDELLRRLRSLGYVR